MNDKSSQPVLCVIPARYASTRLPGKALLQIARHPMIEWVYKRAESCSRVDEVLVATDDERIVKAVESFGGTAVMTSEKCESGTQRVAEAVGEREARIIVNLQGDEPLISPAAVDDLIALFDREPDVQMATLMRPLGSMESVEEPGRVKVVVDNRGYALYFSRCPIPYDRNRGARKPPYYQHYGIYAFRPETLKRFAELPASPLEEAEKLEQLRALSGGIPIRVLETQHASIGVDTPEDLEAVRKMVDKHDITL
jgi:3-deoxy-manno-octulosonate cytidylyltransferase (CMP-KDO synthetase)